MEKLFSLFSGGIRNLFSCWRLPGGGVVSAKFGREVFSVGGGFILIKVCLFCVTATTIPFFSISNTLQDLVFGTTKSFSHNNAFRQKAIGTLSPSPLRPISALQVPLPLPSFPFTPLSSLLPPLRNSRYQPHDGRNPIFYFFQPTPRTTLFPNLCPAKST